MKKLYVIRHSKAVEYASDHSDFNRCLAEYGVEKAQAISSKLRETQAEADMFISSPACRALETAKIFAKAFDYPLDHIQLTDALYHFGGIDYAMEVIRDVPDDVDTLFLFGHNPTFNALAWHLCPAFRDAMPTCAVVGIGFSAKSWDDAITEKGKLITYLTRKRL
jgi:phosphohistidine phosphatase